MFKNPMWLQVVRGVTLAVVVALLGSSPLVGQQRRGRQQDLSQQQVDSLRSAIQELGGRAIIGFKPVEAAQGMLPDGTPALSQGVVQTLAASLSPAGVTVRRQFRLVPAVAVTMDPDGMEALLANFNIDYVEPDALHEPTAVPPMPDIAAPFVQQTPWGILRVNAPLAWPITRGAGASIGIIDTGIDEDHPDLNALDGINTVTGGTARSDWNDNSAFCITHGTHVAGSAAALDNDIGVVGVAPDADLYAIRVFDPENSGAPGCFAFTSDIIAGLEWSVDQTLDVVNMSIGSSFPSLAEGDAVFATHAAGVVVVSSAGNTGTAVGFPAAFPHAMAVAAIDEFDFVAFFSSHGPEVDVAGPGVNVLSTFGGGGLAFLQGTSMASPHAAGVATLIRSASPGLSPDDVREIVRNTADDIAAPGYDYFAGYGVVDAEAAVNAVGTTDFALSTVPGFVTLHAEPAGSPAMETVEIRNVGAAGTIDWTATTSATWLALSAASGSATDVAPSLLDLTADPAGLAPGIYTDFITVEGNAANSPVEIRVRFAVAPRIPLDPAIATAGEIPAGGRTRFVFSGTAGQLVDVVVLTDFEHTIPLFDPFLRIYMPDGETVLILNDNDFVAGLSPQSLVAGVSLPEDGDYFAEVGSFGDFDEGGFLIKARESGPILGVSPPFASLRSEQDGDLVEVDITVFNVTGVGAFDFEVTTFAPWLTADPTSGTASTSEPSVVARRPSWATRGDAPPMTSWDRFEEKRRFRSPEEEAWYDRLELARASNVSEARAGPESATVTLRADPSGLVAGSFEFGVAEFASSDGWLPPTPVFVDFYIYTMGMEIIADGHFVPWGLTADGPDRATGASGNDNGSLFPIEAGELGAAFASDITAFPADVTAGLDGNWYVASNTFDDPHLRQVLPDGTASIFASFDDNPFWVGTGPAGEFYASVTFLGQVYRVSADGSVVEPFGPGESFLPAGIAYHHADDLVYVVRVFDGGVAVLDADGSQVDVVALNVFDPLALTIGGSGKVYISNFFGEVWVYDPSNGTSTAEFLGASPSPFDIFGMTIVEGSLLMSSFLGEFYSFPVDDGLPSAGNILVRLAADDIAHLGGLAKATPGDDFTIPLNIEISPDATAVANYAAGLGWNDTELGLLGLAPGDFTTPEGTGIHNSTSHTTVLLAGAEPQGRGAGGGVFSLWNLDFTADESLVAGDVIEVVIDVTELGSEANEDLLPKLVVLAGLICVSESPIGDVTLDGVVSAADATQMLRHIIDLPLAPGTDMGRGDVNGDGVVGVGDVVEVLRFLVGLPISEDSRLGKPPLEACSSDDGE